MTIAGFEVLTLRPEFSQDPTLTAKRDFQMTGFSQAPQISAYIGERPLHSLKHIFSLKTRTDFFTLFDFMADRCGRWGNFWMPSWHPELSPQTPLLAGSQTLIIKGIGYNDLFLGDTDETRLGHYLWFLSDTGTFFVSKVTSASGGDIDTLQLETAAPVTFTPGRFIVGYLYFVRFVTDSFSFKFAGINEASVTLSMVETLAPESD
jgi:hypothetical protein